jgi:flagellar protein FlaG
MRDTVSGISAGNYFASPSSISPGTKEVAHSRQQPAASVIHTSSLAIPRLQTYDPLPAATVSQTVSFANTMANLFSTTLSFNYDERIDKVVIRVKEGDTDEVIRQIPPEQMVELAATFKHHLRFGQIWR